MDEPEYIEFTVSISSDAEAEAAAIIQMAALMLTGDGGDAYMRAMDLPLSSVGPALTMATSMIATLAEQVARHEECAPEQVLLELRNWMEDLGEPDAD